MRPVWHALAAALLAGCAAVDTGIKTSEDWAELTPAQAIQPMARVDAFAAARDRDPRVGSGACSPSVVERPGGVLEVPDMHPHERYCLGAAPLNVTTIMLPHGARFGSAVSGMQQYLQIDDAVTNGRSVLTLRSLCTPVRRDDDGQIKQPEIYELVQQAALPLCPRPASDLIVTTTAGMVVFRVIFNETTYTRLVEVNDNPVPELGAVSPAIPSRTREAQDLYVVSVTGEPVGWTPDDAWADGHGAVVRWDRPLPTMPGVYAGPEGGQTPPTPAVIHTPAGSTALVFPRRLTEFELRLGDRALRFSALPQRRPTAAPATAGAGGPGDG